MVPLAPSTTTFSGFLGVPPTLAIYDRTPRFRRLSFGYSAEPGSAVRNIIQIYGYIAISLQAVIGGVADFLVRRRERHQQPRRFLQWNDSQPRARRSGDRYPGNSQSPL